MLDKLEELGAEVERVGADWNEAHIMAEYEAKMDTGAFLVHPHAQVGGATLHQRQEDTWEGHLSMVREVAVALGRAPSCLVAASGGGGLVLGLARGADRQAGWEHTRLLAVEPEGAAGLARSLQEGRRVTLDTVDTCATSLAMKSVIPELVEYRCHSSPPPPACGGRTGWRRCR